MALPAESLFPPAADEFEVSLFGPGVGECVVVHVGGGDWVIVDSCMDRTTSRPVAADYLEGLGFELATAVKVLVVTHWHDDHAAGISQLMRSIPIAPIYCSAALNGEEFRRAVIASNYGPDAEHAGVKEFESVFRILQDRTKERAVSVSPKYAQDGTIVYRPEPRTVEILALSPSAATMTLAMHNIANLLPEISALLPEVGRPQRRAVSMQPNKAAVVLSIQAGECQALLGSDLEASSAHNVGWHGVVASTNRHSKKATTFKVPHHGSANADEPAVWEAMLERDPVACLTPFAPSSLPKASDLRRLTSRTKNVYCTASPDPRRPPKRDPAVEKTIRDVVRNHRVLTGAMGHVRYRAPLTGGAGEVTVFSGAYRTVA